MQLTGHVTAQSLMPLAVYKLWRAQHLPQMIAHRRQRSMPLGEHFTVQFEDEMTVRYQIQEMLRIENTTDPDAVQEEVKVYAPLVPDGSNWKATLLIEYTDAKERRSELASLTGVQSRIFVQVEGHDRVFAQANEDLEQGLAALSGAVHFLRFEFSGAMRASVEAGAEVKIGCTHVHYPIQQVIAPQLLAHLVSDWHSA